MGVSSHCGKYIPRVYKVRKVLSKRSKFTIVQAMSIVTAPAVAECNDMKKL